MVGLVDSSGPAALQAQILIPGGPNAPFDPATTHVRGSRYTRACRQRGLGFDGVRRDRAARRMTKQTMRQALAISNENVFQSPRGDWASIGAPCTIVPSTKRPATDEAGACPVSSSRSRLPQREGAFSIRISTSL